jgi:catechol 2,3-dioxygenase-like lactoylglutathione lyase family enzyme
MRFSDAQVILFVADTERAATFYRQFGFEETFRTSGERPVKIELELGGFSIGLALPQPAADSHGVVPVTSGHRACVTLWTDNVEEAYAMALEAGAQDHTPPHAFLDGKLRIAFVIDPDDHPVQLVQRVEP